MNIAILDKLLQEADAISEDEIDTPGEAVRTGEEILGDLSLEQKKLYTLKNRYESNMKELVLQELLVKDDRSKKLASSGSITELIHNIFWFSVLDSTDAWDADVGVRDGWIVVKLPSQPPLQPLGGGGKMQS